MRLPLSLSLSGLFGLAIATFIWFQGQHVPSVSSDPSQPSNPTLASPVPSLFTYRVINAYPHDPKAFTQGLIYYQGDLYEGTGLKGQSSVRRVELTTGRVLQNQPLDGEYFGEGITLWKDHLIQLTWTSRIGFVYDRQTLEKIQEFSYATEGWGLTQDGTHLILSDGSSTLYFLDPETFRPIRTLSVHDQGTPLVYLNELEYINGEIWANVWTSDRLARINPESGQVTGWVDLSGLLASQNLPEQTHPDAVLNGIAYDPAGDRLFVTGKLWPKVFEIQVLPQP